MHSESSKLIRWETPFTEKRFPSVALMIESNPNGIDFLKAIVCPSGIDQYPKYIIDFGQTQAFTCFEEASCPERDFDSAEIEEKNLCAYQYINSPWLKAYEGMEHFFPGGKSDPFLHYLIFGGDNNIEVITPNVPTITLVKEKKMFEFEVEI